MKQSIAVTLLAVVLAGCHPCGVTPKDQVRMKQIQDSAKFSDIGKEMREYQAGKRPTHKVEQSRH